MATMPDSVVLMERLIENNQYAVAAIATEAYFVGHGDGLDEGYKGGYEDGSSEGYSAGYDDGYGDADESAYSSGYEAGSADVAASFAEVSA